LFVTDDRRLFVSGSSIDTGERAHPGRRRPHTGQILSLDRAHTVVLLDEASRYFSERYGAVMVNLMGLVSVAGAAPHDQFTKLEREAEGSACTPTPTSTTACCF